MAKNWCFTFNNYPEDVDEQLLGIECVYLVYQREHGGNGTPHLQGYVAFERKKTLSAVRRFIPAAHWEIARGTPVQNRDYCTKEETRDPDTVPTEFGVLPLGAGARSDLAALAKSIVGGKRLRDVIQDEPEQVVKYHKGLQFLETACAKKRTEKTEVFWYHGATGSGKTKLAFEESPDAYFKMGTSKWWDGYDGTSDVIIDDYRRDLCTFAELLRLFDRYPMYVEVKGGTVQFNPRRIYITTPKSPQDTWEGRTEEDLAQLMRRIEHVVHFNLPL